jgi:hypothetical protein
MTKSPYALFQTDKTAETEGVWLDYGHFRILIRRAGGANTRFARVLESKIKPYRHAFNTGSLDNSIAQRLMVETYAETVVIGWEDVVDQTGEPLPFTVANAVRLFSDLPELFSNVQEQATSLALFRAEEIEAAADFLDVASPGNSNGAQRQSSSKLSKRTAVESLRSTDGQA